MATQTMVAEENRHVAPPKAPALRDRPRERLKEQGAEALTNTVLMAILFRTGFEGGNALAMATRIL